MNSRVDRREKVENIRDKSRRAVSTTGAVFRERRLDKEIQPDMRFTAKTTLERIKNFLETNT